MEWYLILWNIIGFLGGFVGLYTWFYPQTEITTLKANDGLLFTIYVATLVGYIVPFIVFAFIIYSPFFVLEWLAAKLKQKIQQHNNN